MTVLDPGSGSDWTTDVKQVDNWNILVGGTDWTINGKSITKAWVFEDGAWKVFWQQSFGPSTTWTFDAAGSYTFTMPSNISTVELLVVGGGGGGSSKSVCLTTDPSGPFAGGGGGSGGYYFYDLSPGYSVTPNADYSITVGGPGTGGAYPGDCTSAASGSGTNGSGSSFGTVSANGGFGATTNITYPAPGNPGAGGSPSGGNGGGGDEYGYNATQGGDGGTNGSGYGYGGDGGGDATTANGFDGTTGVVRVTAAVLTAIYSTPGTYTFVVPDGVTTLNAVVVGAGGGGGGLDGGGDSHSGGGGGSGGHQSISLAVSPGDPVSITIATGGTRGSDVWNGVPNCVVGTTGYKNGSAGGTTSLTVANISGTVTTGPGGSFQVAGDHTITFTTGVYFRVTGSTGNNGNYTVSSSSFGGGFTTIVVTGSIANSTADGTISIIATGGGGGIGDTGDNGDGYPGAGGYPNGVAGQNPDSFGDPRNHYPTAQGGDNGTGYGRGGNSHNLSIGVPCPDNGQAGAVVFTW